MVFLIMNSIDILEELRMLMMIMTNFVERFHGDVIDRSMTSSQRNDESKRLLEPRLGHKIGIKFAVQGEVI